MALLSSARLAFTGLALIYSFGGPCVELEQVALQRLACMGDRRVCSPGNPPALVGPSSPRGCLASCIAHVLRGGYPCQWSGAWICRMQLQYHSNAHAVGLHSNYKCEVDCSGACTQCRRSMIESCVATRSRCLIIVCKLALNDHL